MSNNNDLDPAASTQMFQAFVERGEAKNPISAERAPAASGSGGGSSSGKVIGIVVALVVVVAVVAFVALH